MKSIETALREAVQQHMAARPGVGAGSYSWLADEVGLSRGSLIKFANGERTMRLDMAAKLAEYLGLELTASADAPAHNHRRRPKTAIGQKRPVNWRDRDK